jgi:hypothetical protein
LVLGYGKKAINAGFSMSLMYFGVILLLEGTYTILIQETLGFSIFAIGFAVTAFGYNGFLNVGNSRRLDEIFKHITYSAAELKYKDNISCGGGFVLSIILIIWGASIALVTGINSEFYSMVFGLTIICIGIFLMIYHIRKMPPTIDNSLCQRVIKQINELNEH